MRGLNSGNIIYLFLTYVFLVTSCEKQNTPEANVVINELMAVNSTTIPDQNGEYDDWIELCNNSSFELDLSGYYISDSRSSLARWQFPAGTKIPAKGYLVIWADADTLQSGLHTNFKLSADGEKLYFSNRKVLIIDKVEYPAQTQELAYARNPDWSGSFRWQTPTFGMTNNLKK
jgi:hypothetical protein